MGEQDDQMWTYSSQIKRQVAMSAFAKRYDDDGTYLYVCSAKPNSATSSAVWQVRRIKNSNGDIDWADGDLKFDNICDNVRTLSYS